MAKGDGDHQLFVKDIRYLKYLSVKEVISDYALLIGHVARELSNGTGDTSWVPTIAYGDGYSGNLATWIRLRYPHVVSG